MTNETIVSDYFQQVVFITKDYLGPASERFVRRQIAFYLAKEPEQLQRQDIPKLAEKMRIALALLTPDKGTVDQAVARIAAILN